MSRAAICADGRDAILRVRVTPRAKSTRITGRKTDADGMERLAIKLAAPPVDNAANRELVAFLATTLRVPRSSVEIVSGDSSRLKTVRVAGLAVDAAKALL